RDAWMIVPMRTNACDETRCHQDTSSRIRRALRTRRILLIPPFRRRSRSASILVVTHSQRRAERARPPHDPRARPHDPRPTREPGRREQDHTLHDSPHGFHEPRHSPPPARQEIPFAPDDRIPLPVRPLEDPPRARPFGWHPVLYDGLVREYDPGPGTADTHEEMRVAPR